MKVVATILMTKKELVDDYKWWLENESDIDFHDLIESGFPGIKKITTEEILADEGYQDYIQGLWVNIGAEDGCSDFDITEQELNIKVVTPEEKRKAQKK